MWRLLKPLAKSLTFWVGVSVAGIVALGVVLSVDNWDWLQGGTDHAGNAEAVRTVALIVGGIVTIVLALWRSVLAERHAAATQRQSETGARTYLNERYRHAASMLGDSELMVRVGGVVALERLAEDHPGEFAHESFRLLLEMVRTPPTVQQPQPTIWDGLLVLKRPAARQDVQEAIKVIARLQQLPGIRDAMGPLNLRGAQLCGVELWGLRLNGALLENADLRYACLTNMNLTNAQLQWANCRQARFDSADLSGAEMSDADFSGVRARHCKFRGATMPAQMVDADLHEADLTEVMCPNTDLTGAMLHGANVTGANLRGQVYWIDRAGQHEGNGVKVTQEQLDEAVADAERPPTLSVEPAGDTEPRKRLVWRGKAPSSGGGA